MFSYTEYQVTGKNYLEFNMQYVPLASTFITVAELADTYYLLKFLRRSSQRNWLKLGPFKIRPDNALRQKYRGLTHVMVDSGQVNVYIMLFLVLSMRFSQRTELQRIFDGEKNVFICLFYDSAAEYFQLIYYNYWMWHLSPRKICPPTFLLPYTYYTYNSQLEVESCK